MEAIINYQERMNIYALILLSTGLFIVYIIGRRRFYRRNMAGMQLFENYHSALLTIWMETLALWLGRLMVLVAALVYLFK